MLFVFVNGSGFYVLSIMYFMYVTLYVFHKETLCKYKSKYFMGWILHICFPL